MADKRIKNLVQNTTVPGTLEIPADNPTNDKTEKNTVHGLAGGVRASGIEWDSTTPYDIPKIVLFQNRAWKTLINSNLNNPPSENAKWTEVAISRSDGTLPAPWEAGVFTYLRSVVEVDNVLYVLQDTVSYPFESTVTPPNSNWGTAPVGPQDEIQLNVNTNPTDAPGVISFDGVDFNGRDNISGTLLQFGKEVAVDAYNNNGVTFNNFTVVNYDTAVGGQPGAKLAIADDSDNADGSIVVTHDILVGAVGKTTYIGKAGGVTDVFGAEDDLLFLSATVAGQMTNQEQPLLVLLGRILVASADPNVGALLLTPSRIINPVGIGQSAGQGETQGISAVPEKCYCFDAEKFELNVDVTQTLNPAGGEDGYDAVMSPASVGATGRYTIRFSCAMTGSANTQYFFELYRSGVPTGVLDIVDLQNNNIDAGGVDIVGTFTTPITDTDTVEIYIYTSLGAATVVYDSVLFEIERKPELT